MQDMGAELSVATEKYNSSAPVNLGAGFEISIMDLLTKIVNLTGFKGEVFWDGSKPDGQPRRMLNTNKARKKFGFEAETTFDDGLKETIESFLESF